MSPSARRETLTRRRARLCAAAGNRPVCQAEHRWQTATPEEYLTVAEIAATLKLNQQTVRNWIDRGELPALRVGRRVRVRRSDFDALIAEGSSQSAPAEAPRSIWDGSIPDPQLPPA